MLSYHLRLSAVTSLGVLEPSAILPVTIEAHEPWETPLTAGPLMASMCLDLEGLVYHNRPSGLSGHQQAHNRMTHSIHVGTR